MPREVEIVRRAVRTAAIRLPEVFAPRARLIVGFSGGQDSTCLLHALANAHRKLDLLAVHIDHALRPESAAAAQRVAERAEALGVACRVVRVDVEGYRAGWKGASVQQAARAARYQALVAAACEREATAILVAHTADDQAETMLLNLLRGTALLGLAGMQMDGPLDVMRFGPPAAAGRSPERGPRLVRPLLRVARATTLAYCMQLGLSIVEDASNQTRAYTRNRVRLDLLPVLEQFNPAVREVLARTAELAADDVALLDALAADAHASLRTDGHYHLARFRAQPRALQRRVLRLALQASGVSLVDVADSPLEDALDLLQTGQPNQTYPLPNGVEVVINKETFMLQRHERAPERQPDNTGDVAGPRV